MIDRKALWLVPLLLAGCGPKRPPPPSTSFDGMPVTGNLADARRAGFTDCVSFDAASMRCRKHKATLEGAGPYEAAVDLVGGDGSGGFDQVTLWHDLDQDAVYKITDALEQKGWLSCNIGTPDDHGDQIIYTRPGVRARISMDLSYWGKRRLRVLPASNRERRCVPDPTTRHRAPR